MKTAIINFGKGAWYPRGQQRLIESLKTVGFDGDVLAFTDEAQIGSPTHQESPYAFKPFALKYAADRGYELVLWCDCSVWAIKPVQPMFDYIAEHGHLLFKNAGLGYYTSDACLAAFGIDREASFTMDMLMGICMGFDLRRDKCIQFLAEWLERSQDGVTFRGSWTNHNREVSNDPRVAGHRHDQSVASCLAIKLKMELIVAHLSLFQYYENAQKTVYAANPNYDMINPGVVMVAQGL